MFETVPISRSWILAKISIIVIIESYDKGPGQKQLFKNKIVKNKCTLAFDVVIVLKLGET